MKITENLKTKMKFKIRCRYRITMRTMVHALAHCSHTISKKISATFHRPSVLIACDALWSAEFSRLTKKLCVSSFLWTEPIWWNPSVYETQIGKKTSS